MGRGTGQNLSYLGIQRSSALKKQLEWTIGGRDTNGLLSTYIVDTDQIGLYLARAKQESPWCWSAEATAALSIRCI